MSSARAGSTPLLDAIAAGDEKRVRRLLRSGTNPRLGDGRQTPLHAAARGADAAIVEALIEAGALEWQPDADGRPALDVARENPTDARQAIVALLDRSSIADPSFRAAVAALHAGDGARLATLIDAEPRLLHERIAGPEAYRRATRSDYFRDPKLVWFVANNPQRVEHLPPNIVAVTRVMLERGVPREDLDIALGLVMTSAAARSDGVQLALMRTMLEFGAAVRPEDALATAAYGEYAALRAAIDAGALQLTAPLAAALGEDHDLEQLLANDPSSLQSAFALAVIGKHTATAERLLRAGADVSAPLVVHAHSTALHQAVAGDDAPMIALLVRHGASRAARDGLWNATPLEWAEHLGRPAAFAALERAG